VKNIMDANKQLFFTATDIEDKLLAFHCNEHPLPVIASPVDLGHIASLIAGAANELTGLTETAANSLTTAVTDPGNSNFDPLATAVWWFYRQEIEEACWLLFLCSYIGKHPKQNWNLLRTIYGGLYGGNVWTWKEVSAKSEAFQGWLLHHQTELGESGSMGDAHKCVVFDYQKAMVAAKDIGNYISWVRHEGNHEQLLGNALVIGKKEPAAVFHYLYLSMNERVRIRKSIKFNYLCLIGAIGLASVEPGQPYLSDLLFSKKGARWLFGTDKMDKIPTRELNEVVISLAQYLELPFGIPVLHKAFEQLGKERHWVDVKKFKWRYNR
jgi:hypothetical protein